MSGRILVTPRSATRDGHPALGKLADAGYESVFCRPGVLPDEAELLTLLPGCVGYLAGVENVSGRVLEVSKDLRAISRNGTGADAIDMATAERLGIRVLRAEGANARGVAELALALILCLARSLTASDRALKAHRWERHAGFELEGRTLGLVGCGRIGRLVTGFAHAFGMNVVAYDPFPNWDDAPEAFRYASLEETLAAGDVVSLHCPPRAGGRPVLDSAAIDTLKRGCLVVNTARGGLIDSEAMLRALEDGWVAGVGLDVFDGEPPTDWRLAEHPRVVSTAHIGGFTPESIDRALTTAVDNLLSFLATAPLRR